MWRTLILAAALIAANRADYRTTRYILDRGGREVNPPQRWLINHQPVSYMIDLTACLYAERQRRHANRYWYAIPFGLTTGHTVGYVVNSHTIKEKLR